MPPKVEPARESAERELKITRVFDAPREVVFKAWTDPKLLAQWWGPKGFTNPVCELDARPGGAIRVHMRGPDGTVYPMGGMFHEIGNRSESCSPARRTKTRRASPNWKCSTP